MSTVVNDYNRLIVAAPDNGDDTKLKLLEKPASCSARDRSDDAIDPAAVAETTFTFAEPFVPINDSDDDAVSTAIETETIAEPFVLSDYSDDEDVERQPLTSKCYETPQLNSNDHHSSTRQVSQGSAAADLTLSPSVPQ